MRERHTSVERVICREGTSRGRAAPWNIEKGATDTGQHVECLLYCVCAHVDASSGWLADGGRVRTLKSAVERRWGALERAGAGPRRCVCCIYHVCTIKCAGHTARRSSRHSLKT